MKLNARFETLQAEYNRLTQANLEPTIEMTTEEFNEWVGFPKEAIAQLAPEKAKDIPKTLMQPLSDLNDFGKQRTKQLEAMQDKGLVI